MTGQQIVDEARKTLLESTASFWTDAELLAHVNNGIADLWRAFADNYQDYWFAKDETILMAANAAVLSSSGTFPTNVAKVQAIEPLDRDSYPQLNFFPRAYASVDASNARAAQAVDPSQAGKIYYSITGAGGPIGAPTIYVAPRVSSQVTLRLIYTPSIPKIALADANPVPGESDRALINYVIAQGLAKEREDRKPDPDFLVLYATEKSNLTTFVAPRQEDEPQVVEALFERYWE